MRKQKGNLLYIVLVFGLFAVMGLITVLAPQKIYSENENRYLETLPEFSWKDFLSGEYQSKMEKAYSDQFVKRDLWMMSSTEQKKILGLKDIDGVYMGKDGYYLAKTCQDDIDQKLFLKNLRYVEYFGDKASGKVSTMLVPSPATILSEKLPKNAPYYDADAMYDAADALLKQAKLVDVRSSIKEYSGQNQVYFKTDHHWTLLGAYAAYSTYCDANKLQKHTYGYFAPEKIATDFKGTMYSKVLDPFSTQDELYSATKVPQAKVICDGQEKSLYAVSKLLEKDKYAYFFGGNYGKVTISNADSKATGKLLVVKDSFANSFVPFLVDDFKEITMIDLRFYKESMQSLLKEEKYDNILVLYEMSNFAQDTNLYKLVH